MQHPIALTLNSWEGQGHLNFDQQRLSQMKSNKGNKKARTIPKSKCNFKSTQGSRFSHSDLEMRCVTVCASTNSNTQLSSNVCQLHFLQNTTKFDVMLLKGIYATYMTKYEKKCWDRFPLYSGFFY